MYGMNAAMPASGAGAALAYTGLNVGAGLLTALGILLFGVALLALARRSGKIRP
jgi:hypothetical protein